MCFITDDTILQGRIQSELRVSTSIKAYLGIQPWREGITLRIFQG